MVSIVVPIYNTATYLRRCINSIISQTYTNIEVWLIDDGSTDGSAEICDEYAALDSRIHTVHKKNGGESSARNTGLALATGDYLAFCDSDDEYLPDAIENLLKGMDVEGVDLVKGAYLEKKGDNLRFISTLGQQYTPSEIALKMLTDPSPCGASYIMKVVNGTLFKLSIFREYNITFNESVVIGNDTLINCDYLEHCNKVFDILTPVYIYYIYEPAERMQGVTWVYPDVYEVLIPYTEKLLRISDADNKTREKILSNFFDDFIRILVNATIYEEYFPAGFINELRKLANISFVCEAASVYRRTRIRDSRLIPLFFKTKHFYLLLLILRHRAKRIVMVNGKSQLVRLITKI